MEIATTIEVPLAGSINTTPSGYNCLIRFYNSCRVHYNCIIFINIADLRWIDANLSASLQAVLYKLNKDNCLSFTIDLEDVKKRFPILFRNGFLTSLLAIPDLAGTTVEMKTFTPTSDMDFYNYITEQLLGHPQMTANNCSDLVDYYMEVFTNVEKHARTSDPVFVCGQFFPSSQRLYFTIVDLGVGFLPPIQEYTNGKVTTTKQAISWALEFNHSSNLENQTGGLGLYNLLEHCRKNGGEFNIITGDAYWGNNLGEMGTRTVPEFVGTTIHLIYNCK